MTRSLTAHQFARILRAAAEEAERIEQEHVAERHDWTPQERSPLGQRRHVRAVRARIALGKVDAAMVGRRALLSAGALAEELAKLSAKPSRAVDASSVDELRAELGLCVVGGKR